MKHLPALLFFLALLSGCSSKSNRQSEAMIETAKEETTSNLYEMRTYYAADGKLEDLLTRFRDHTTSLFEKHGMLNVGYWVPVENEENTLVYLLEHSDIETKESSWVNFINDPEWQSVYEASISDGRLVDSIESILLYRTKYSPEVQLVDNSPRIFELRVYYTNEGKLPDLNSRFENHTMEIFENNGMTNIVYFEMENSQSNASNTLYYFLAHSDTAQARMNWSSFLEDPDWQKTYEESIKEGKLVGQITSTFITPTDFSPLK